MPKIHIDDYDDWDEIESELPSQERILRRPKLERDAGRTIKQSKRDPEAAKRKEFHEDV